MSVSLDLENMHRMYDILATGVGIIDSDTVESVLFANKNVLKYYDCSNEEEFMTFCGGRFSGMTLESDLHVNILASRQRPGYIRYQFRTREGRIRVADAIVSTDQLEGHPVYILQIRIQAVEDEKMTSDELTGLPGEREFYQRAISLSREKKNEGDFTKFCPVYFNIANFRGFNRMHGTEAGDRALRFVADTLVAAFPQSLIGHFSGDNFAAILPRDTVFAGVSGACHDVDRYLGSGSVSLKAGIVAFDQQVSPSVILHAFDMAKIACASVKNNAQASWAIYNDSMRNRIEMRQYILDNFDRALKEGYIKVFYQPVVRVLSGKVCSYEALARWEDPEKGFISPGIFVPILEEAHLVGRLDAYVIDNVMRLMHDRLASGSVVLPVSLNLSRLDFALIQPLQRIEEAAQRYQIPKKYIHVEITETVLAKSGDDLADQLTEFSRAGYEVWLVDFGSEYSSLKTLHNYDFNMLKIDMGFFSNYNEKGKNIIESVVYMAKRLGMHTLAEGVETREQVDFLHSIGCERIQGYYYGKPMQADLGLMEIAKKNMTMEAEAEAPLFEAAGLVNIAKDSPAAIFIYDGRYPHMLTMNDAFVGEMRTEGTQDLEAANRQLCDDSCRLSVRLRNYISQAYDGGQRTLVYSKNGHYMQFRAQRIAGSRDNWIGQSSLMNISTDEQREASTKINSMIKNMVQFYDGLYCIHPDSGEVEVLSSLHADYSLGMQCAGSDAFISRFAEMFVLPEDCQRFFAFMDVHNLRAEARDSGRGEAQDLFRVRNNTEEDNYRWTVFRAVWLADAGQENMILISEQEDLWERHRNRAGLLPIFASSFSVAVRTDVVESQDEKCPQPSAADEKTNKTCTVGQKKAVTPELTAAVPEKDTLLDVEAWTDSVITQGIEEQDPVLGIQKSIMLIAQNLRAERFLIFEKGEADAVSCTYEWVRYGFTPMKYELQGIPEKNMAPLYSAFEKHRVAIVADAETFFKNHPDFVLPVAGVHNIISGMLTDSGKPIGFTMVLNSSPANLRANGYMLATLTNFLAVLIRHRNVIAEKEEESCRDDLTGALNRKGIRRYFSQRKDNGSLAIIVVKLLNLREINATQGYTVGDSILCRLNELLKHSADEDHTARLDGDEFMVIEESMDEAGVRLQMEKIRNGCLVQGIREIMGYEVHEGPMDRETFDHMLIRAETNMS